MGRPVIQPWCGARNAGSQNGWKSSLCLTSLDFFPCSVTLQEIVNTELLDKKYNEDEARVSADHLQNA